MRLRAVLLALSCAWAGAAPAGSDPLDECRALRHSEPARALPQCEQAATALQRQGRGGDAFEAWMHAAEVASQLGDSARAEAALDHGSALLSQVSDPLAAQRVARRRALTAYRDQRPLDALRHFLVALAAARAVGDAPAVSVSDNDLGVVYRHLGDLPAALEHFQASLDAKEALGETDLGSTLGNIGSLQRQLGDLPRAREYLRRALQQHRQAGKPLLEAQTLEELARTSGAGEARDGLAQAWGLVEEAGSPRDQLRVALHRAEFEADAGNAGEAAQWLDRARTLAAALGREEPLQALLVAARLASAPARQRALHDELAARLAGGAASEDPARVLEAREVLSKLSEALGDTASALAEARAFQRERARYDQTRHGERLDALRIRFEVAQLESERDRLRAQAGLQQAELQRQRARTWTVASIALLALALLALYSQHRLSRHRWRAQAERAALEARIVQARQAADLLRSDLRSLAWLLDQQQIAALIFDAGRRVRALTAHAAAHLPPMAADASLLDDAIGAELAAWAQQAVESASLGEAATADARRPLSDSVTLRCLPIALEEELGVLLFDTASAPPAAPPIALQAGARADEPGDGVDAGSRQEFRRQLVSLMQACLEAWERSTRKGRIDLAEASGVWRITVDDGRLRVRAMDRYLSLETLPERPRWREVLRTAYYVLAEVTLEAAQRQRIETLVEAVLASMRRSEG